MACGDVENEPLLEEQPEHRQGGDGQEIQYALEPLSTKVPQVAVYLDAAHAGWVAEQLPGIPPDPAAHGRATCRAAGFCDGCRQLPAAGAALPAGAGRRHAAARPGPGLDYRPKQAELIQMGINADRIGLAKPVSVAIEG